MTQPGVIPKIRALVVDDEAMIRQLITTILERRGLEVVAAPDGKRALEICLNQKKPFDCLIVDILMPELDGPELVRQLRCSAIRSPVLFITGYSPREANDIEMESKHLVLQKPFAIPAFIEAIEYLVSESPGRAKSYPTSS